jgi:hypothetical protein
MTESDFSCPCIIGYGSSPSRCGPPYSTHITRQRRPDARPPRFEGSILVEFSRVVSEWALGRSSAHAGSTTKPTVTATTAINAAIRIFETRFRGFSSFFGALQRRAATGSLRRLTLVVFRWCVSIVTPLAAARIEPGVMPPRASLNAFARQSRQRMARDHQFLLGRNNVKGHTAIGRRYAGRVCRIRFLIQNRTQPGEPGRNARADSPMLPPACRHEARRDSRNNQVQTRPAGPCSIAGRARRC